MESLYNIINEGLEYCKDDYNKFIKDYNKFKSYIEENVDGKSIEHALEQIDQWVDELKSKKGLPMSYHRYEQFTYALVTYDGSAREGAGDVYDDKITDTLIKAWEKSTGYKIKNIYI